MRKYFLFSCMALQEMAEYRVNFLWRIAGTAIYTLALYSFWIAILGSGFGNQYFTAQTFALYYLAITFVQTLTDSEIWRIANPIYSGRFSTDLLKPYSFSLKVIAESLPDKFVQIFIISLVYLIIHSLGAKYNLNIGQFLLVLLSLTLSWAGKFFIGMFLGGLSFWFKRIQGFVSLFWNIGGLFSGEMIPIVFLPTILLNISAKLPFRYWLYFPAQLMLGNVTDSEIR